MFKPDWALKKKNKKEQKAARPQQGGNSTQTSNATHNANLTSHRGKGDVANHGQPTASHKEPLQLSRPSLSKPKHQRFKPKLKNDARLASNGLSLQRGGKGTSPQHRAAISTPTEQQQQQQRKRSADDRVPEDAKHSKKQKQDKNNWPFETDYNDHFETSHQSLKDLEPLLYKLARLLGKAKEDLVIYDPYYCQGSIRAHYKALGFHHLIHENRDFYQDVQHNLVPDYDILVTNPPYSGDHKERILAFCMASGRPWALLMPCYVASKQYYASLLQGFLDGGVCGGGRGDGDGGPKKSLHGKKGTKSGQSPGISDKPKSKSLGPAPQQQQRGKQQQQDGSDQEDQQQQGPPPQPFYAVPKEPYEYEHPEGTGHDTSPFTSMWYVHVGRRTPQVLKWWQGQAVQRLQLLAGVEALKQEAKVLPAGKRLNPKQRRRLKQKLLGGGGA